MKWCKKVWNYCPFYISDTSVKKYKTIVHYIFLWNLETVIYFSQSSWLILAAFLVLVDVLCTVIVKFTWCSSNEHVIVGTLTYKRLVQTSLKEHPRSLRDQSQKQHNSQLSRTSCIICVDWTRSTIILPGIKTCHYQLINGRWNICTY